MLKENKELENLKTKKKRIQYEIDHCSCWYGGMGLGGFSRQPCVLCECRELEKTRIDKRIAKIKAQNTN